MGALQKDHQDIEIEVLSDDVQEVMTVVNETTVVNEIVTATSPVPRDIANQAMTTINKGRRLLSYKGTCLLVN